MVIINKILGRIKNKKINNLIIGRNVKFINNGVDRQHKVDISVTKQSYT
jgi:hypothetical protein